MNAKKQIQYGQVYDSLYGFIRLTATEEAIINTPFYQRLRWIKQLGFASYIFAGAEHSRFSHAIGVMHTADQMVRSIGRATSDEKLFDVKATDEKTLFHKSIRIAALLHDIGTFPFSHSIEGSYIRWGKDLQDKGKLPGKQLPNNHEHLGSFIIKNTDYKGGITKILKEAGIDYAKLSKLIKGESPSMVANQILHSDLDADRMDYLLRDAHHTGIKYGHIDREYLLFHLGTAKTDSNVEVLGVKENALHALEDFLIARFAWYSQVVRNSNSAKFDVLAAHIAHHLLQKKMITSFDELLELVSDDPERFFAFNDNYFISRLQEIYLGKKIKDAQILELIRMLLYRIPPKTVRIEETKHRLLRIHSANQLESEKSSAVLELKSKIKEIESIFSKFGNGTEWIVVDNPSKDLVFTKDLKSLSESVKGDKNKKSSIRSLRDPVKLIGRDGRPRLLIESSNSLVSKLVGHANFIPNIYTNSAGLELLNKKKFC